LFTFNIFIFNVIIRVVTRIHRLFPFVRTVLSQHFRSIWDAPLHIQVGNGTDNEDGENDEEVEAFEDDDDV